MKKKKTVYPLYPPKKIKDIYQSSADARFTFFNLVDDTESSQSLRISSGGTQGWLQYWRMTQGFMFGNGTPSLKLTAKAPENEWLEYFLVSFWGKTPIFRCYVSFKECISYAKGSPFKHFGGLVIVVIHDPTRSMGRNESSEFCWEILILPTFPWQLLPRD